MERKYILKNVMLFISINYSNNMKHAHNGTLTDLREKVFSENATYCP